jgi:prepilin-type N-terminal cleavage/methylation domain-containing protein
LINNQKGFTLIEIIAVLLILGVLAGMATTKMMLLDTGSKMATQVASELSTREKLVWSNTKMSDYVEDIDAAVFNAMSYDVGAAWTSGPDKNGGIINIDGTATTLKRTHATQTEPAMWSR